MADDGLRDFEAGVFTHEGDGEIVLRKGSGPAAIVIAGPFGVLTEHLIDEPGQPTREALDRLLELFRSRLLAPA